MKLSKLKKKIPSLHVRKKKFAGRNNTGRITVAHQGGGHKQNYRKISMQGLNLTGFVVNLEYDPNRTAHLAKVYDSLQKTYSYILAPTHIKALDFISPLTKKNSENEITVLKQIGGCFLLEDLSVGDYIYNIELTPGQGGQLVRSAGGFATILQKTPTHVIIKMPSGEHRMILKTCTAFLGNLSNENQMNISWKKAGKSRWLNIRPTVRGVAKNPIDHPHGGNTSGGCHPVTPWARLTKGKPTRSKKKKNFLIIKKYKDR